MARAENTDLIVNLTLKDNLSGPLAAAKQNVDALGESAAAQSNVLERSFSKVGNVLESGRSKIREFARAGSELSVVASSLGPEFDSALGPVGEFIHLAGEAGLVASAFADLGPAAVKGVAGILSIGTAAATATPELVSFAAAEELAKANAVGLGSLALGIAGVATAGAAGAIALEQYSEAQDRSLAPTRAAARAAEEQQAILALYPNLTSLASVGLDGLVGHVDESTHSLEGFGYQLTQEAGNLQNMGNDVDTLGGSFDNSLNPALNNTGTNVSALTEKVDRLGLALTDLPQEIPINITVNTLFAKGAGAATIGIPAGVAGNVDQLPGASASLPAANSLAAAEEAARKAKAAADEAARKAAQAADEAARKAKQRAEELAQAYRDRVSVEFDHAKKIGDTLFDSLHDRITKAIKDAETLAEKQHDAALQAISDNLKAEQAAHAAPVNAAEAALAQRQAEEQRRNLLEAKQAAAEALRTNVDPTQTAQLQRALRDATEALANFDAQAAIDRLKTVQAGLDAASQAKADAATKEADAKLAAAKAEAQKQQDAETLAAKKRKDDFETQLTALQKRDTALGKTPKQIQADIDALEQRFGITTDKLGFHHIEDPLVSAIKSVKIEPPPITIVNNQKFLLQVGAQELRLIASALASGNQPAATSSVRTGAGGRG